MGTGGSGMRFQVVLSSSRAVTRSQATDKCRGEMFSAYPDPQLHGGGDRHKENVSVRVNLNVARSDTLVDSLY